MCLSLACMELNVSPPPSSFTSSLPALGPLGNSVLIVSSSILGHFFPVKFLITHPKMSGSKFSPRGLVLYYLATLKLILFRELPKMLPFVQPQQLEYTSNSFQCWTIWEYIKWNERVSTGFSLPSREHVCYQHWYHLCGKFRVKHMDLKQNSFSFVTFHKQYSCHCTVIIP